MKEAAKKKMGDSTVQKRIRYYQDVYLRVTADYRRFFAGDELERLERRIRFEQRYLTAYADELLADYLISGKAFADDDRENRCQDERYRLVPRRLFRGPVTFVGFVSSLSPELQEEYRQLKSAYPQFFGINSMNDFILHRVDGTRNLLEIAEGAAIEGKRYDPDYVYDYLHFLAHAGLVAFS